MGRNVRALFLHLVGDGDDGCVDVRRFDALCLELERQRWFHPLLHPELFERRERWLK